MFTVQYPEERAVLMPRSRGALMMKRHPVTGQPNCVGCYRCALACPIGCIQVRVTEHSDGTRRMDRLLAIGDRHYHLRKDR